MKDHAVKDQPEGTAGFYDAARCDVQAFAQITAQTLNPAHVPGAVEVAQNIPIYDAQALAARIAGKDARRAIMTEWGQVLLRGPGVLVIRQAQPDHAAIDAASAVFERIIAAEKAAGGEGADHFAAAGSNDRIWNALQKLCLADPATHIRYFDSPAMDAVCEAWLGPNYQMTAQINLVHPGGLAQQAHRDYHLGFQTAEISATYPAHVHDLSPLMTLQGGLAHCDMDVEAGPTKLLPFSQAYRPGYAAWRREDFRAHFEAHCVQLPMSKGDAVFFNPALFHAAGENRSADVRRMVNLFQVSSAFGRAMESVDRAAMCRAVFAPLAQAHTDGQIDNAGLAAVIAATAEGYSFPTNLDSDPPAGGLAPETQAQLLRRMLAKASQAEFDAALAQQGARRRP